jgi:predicted small lipoprotein YifL
MMITRMRISLAAASCFALASCGEFGGLSTGFPPSETAAAAAAGRPLSAEELRAIYADRTWLWENGAGYFDARTNAFSAWSGEDANASYAQGEWFLLQPGRMCFSATWSAVDGSADARTCFDHRADEERIFQRRAPLGEWYVFAHRPALEGDEILELREGDFVRRNFERNRAMVDGVRPSL